jgi:hypothetical protein
MDNEQLKNPERQIDNSYAKISENTVEIFDQTFPLNWPYYYPTGRLESFSIEHTVIEYMNKKLPIRHKIYLYEDGKFHETCIYDKYVYEHKGQLFTIGGSISFYKNGNLESFHIKDMEIETNFIVDGKTLILYRGQQVFFMKKADFQGPLN